MFCLMIDTTETEKGLGLRELKRRRTHRAILDAATRLVEERGFDQVTVEDICDDAEISKRTFFNYFDSKDEAVLGKPALDLSEERAATFLAAPTSNLVAHTLRSFVCLDDDEDEFHQIIAARRRAIFAADPALNLLATNRFKEMSARIQELLLAYLSRHPDCRRLPQVSEEVEATVILGMVKHSWWILIAGHGARSVDGLINSAQLFSHYAKDVEW